MERPTGEDLYTEDNYDYIPGASVFYKPDSNEDLTQSKYENDASIMGGLLPSNPEDYLRSVQLEAKQCPDVVVANIDVSKFKSKKAPCTKSAFQSTLAASKFAPTKKWCNYQVKAFSRSRQEFVKHMAQLKCINKQSKRRPKLPVYPLPSWDDQVNWRYFCLGNKLEPLAADLSKDYDMTDSNVVIEDDTLDDLSDALVAAEESKPQKQDTQVPEEGDAVLDLSTLENGFPPMLRILLRLEPKQVQYNLAYQVEWLKTYGFSRDQGKWIYALMTCLEKPLYPSVISTLRDLSRQCAQLRAKVSPNSGEMNGLNLIICLVGKYFDQADLLDAV